MILARFGVALAGPVRPALESALDVCSPVALAARGVLVGLHQREDLGHLRVLPERLLDDVGIKQTLINKKRQKFSSTAEVWAYLEDSNTLLGRRRSNIPCQCARDTNDLVELTQTQQRFCASKCVGP